MNRIMAGMKKRDILLGGILGTMLILAGCPACVGVKEPLPPAVEFSYPPPGALQATSLPTPATAQATPTVELPSTRMPVITIPQTAAPPAAPAKRPTPGLDHPPATQLDPGQRAARLAARDLANRLGVRPDQIQVVLVVADEFPASGLGCQAPGVTLAPNEGLIGGFRVILASAGKQYEYHLHGGNRAYCGQIH